MLRILDNQKDLYIPYISYTSHQSAMYRNTDEISKMNQPQNNSENKNILKQSTASSPLNDL